MYWQVMAACCRPSDDWLRSREWQMIVVGTSACGCCACAHVRSRASPRRSEMIHTASLLHDDVIDLADTRRGVGSVNSVFGNQLAVLAGAYPASHVPHKRPPHPRARARDLTVSTRDAAAHR